MSDIDTAFEVIDAEMNKLLRSNNNLYATVAYNIVKQLRQQIVDELAKPPGY